MEWNMEKMATALTETFSIALTPYHQGAVDIAINYLAKFQNGNPVINELAQTWFYLNLPNCNYEKLFGKHSQANGGFHNYNYHYLGYLY